MIVHLYSDNALNKLGYKKNLLFSIDYRYTRDYKNLMLADVTWSHTCIDTHYLKNRFGSVLAEVPVEEISILKNFENGHYDNWYHFNIQMDSVDYWVENYITGKYVRLYTHVWLESENDASWWILKWS